MPPAIVFLHAHPDDEAIFTGGTMALLAARGVRVVLVVATAGELGAATGALDPTSLPAHRRTETDAAAAALGIARVAFLGYRDSGMPGDPANDAPGSFFAADTDEAAGAVAAILREESAAAIVVYDAGGIYGHPDHVQVHRVAAEAATTVGVPLLAVTIDREFLSGGIELARSMGLEVPDGFVPPDVSSWYTAHDDITHTVDAGPALSAKRASMAAHATQTTGAPDSVRTLAVFLGLPEEIFALAFASEWFVLDAASSGRAPGSPEDLFPGLFTPASAT
jgi:LmbE family N-acetylglucosaminyl deacetylase